MPLKLNSILETVIYASDLAAAERFYADILGLELHGRLEGRSVFFRVGNAMLLIFNPATTGDPKKEVIVGGAPIPLHGTTGSGHFAFSVADTDLDSWVALLQSRGVEIESDIRWPKGGRSIYFRDPAGNSVELASPTLWSNSQTTPPTSARR